MNKIEKKKRNFRSEKMVCLFGYILVPLFFIIMYFLMTETYEDITQFNSESAMSVPDIMNKIYHYIPRLGEFFQHIAVHFMTPQLSFGFDIVFRLITALIATGVVYLSVIFILGRKPRLQYGDMVISLGVLLFLMVSIFSEAFTYRFSYANNYVLGLLVGVGFLTLFRLKVLADKWWKIAGVLLLGFVFGISTEIAPVAFLILVVGWLGICLIKKRICWKDLLGKYRLQTLAMIGLILGLAFFYVGGGIGERTGGGYADVYEYISPMGIFRQPFETLSGLVSHAWYNMRYLFFAISLMLVYIFAEFTIFKKERGDFKFWQVMLFAFCVLFIGATSLIAVHDDLYPRFMVPVFLAIALATFLFIQHVLNYVKIREKSIKIVSGVVLTLGVVLVIDMTVAFSCYNVKMKPKLDAIHYNPGGSLTIDPIENADMRPSEVFKLKQLPPFNWGPAADYTKFGL